MLEYDGQFLICGDKWVIDLKKVNFITLKQNWEDENYHIKLHIGTKEVRLILESEKELDTLRHQWIKINR